jgi:hypothetical protein
LISGYLNEVKIITILQEGQTVKSPAEKEEIHFIGEVTLTTCKNSKK